MIYDSIAFLADRKALALDPDCGDVMKRGDSESSVSENRLQLSPTEKVIAEVWADVLDIPLSNLTHTSHFTEVGGHSLFLFEVLMGIKEKVCCRDSSTFLRAICVYSRKIKVCFLHYFSNPMPR